MARTLKRRIGRRGASLLFFAFLDVAYAGSLAIPPKGPAMSPTLQFVASLAPLPAWATLWGAVGIVCLIGAFKRRDRIAFGAAMALKVLWGLTYAGGWLLANLDRAWVGAALWLALSGWVYIISTWPEPAEGLPPTESGGR